MEDALLLRSRLVLALEQGTLWQLWGLQEAPPEKGAA
jgi:hypothetical protein